MMDIVYGLVTFLAGLGVLLFSIKLIGEALEKTSGSKLRKSFSNMTQNKFKGMGLGLGVTLLLQSSTASMAMTVALCDAGIIAFTQTIPLILGFNIGSSLTIILVSFGSVKIVQILSVLTFIGAIMFLFAKKQTVKNIGRLIIGFGSLFLSITLMTSGMSVLNEKNIFNFITYVTHPLLLIPLFTIFTTIIHTTLGSVAILITFLGTATIPGVMTLNAGLWALIGINIGASLASYMSTIGASKTAKRAGLTHITFKLLGAIIWSVLLLLLPFDKWFLSSGIQPGFVVFIFDVMINVSTAFILLPFTNVLYKLIMKIYPDKAPGGKSKTLIKLDDQLLETPTIAIGSLIKKTKEVYLLLTQKVIECINFLFIEDPKTAVILRDCMEIEGVLTNIEENLLKVSANSSESDQNKIQMMLQMIKRARDLIKTIRKLVRYLEAKEGTLTASELEEFKRISDKIRLMIIATLTATDVVDMDLLIEKEPLLVRVLELDSEINEATNAMKVEGLKKVKSGQKKISNFTNLNTLLDIFERYSEYLRAISVVVSK